MCDTNSGGNELISRRGISIFGLNCLLLPNVTTAKPHSASTVIGIGRLGNAVLDRMKGEDAPGTRARLWGVDRVDAPSNASIRFRSGMRSDPLRRDFSNLRKELVIEDYVKLKDLVQATNHLILITGIGGMVSNSLTPLFALYAKLWGINTTAILTLPFEWEHSRARTALSTAMQITQNVRHTVLLPNEDYEMLGFGDRNLDECWDYLEDRAYRQVKSHLARVCSAQP